jgi:hypothetical protein
MYTAGRPEGHWCGAGWCRVGGPAPRGADGDRNVLAYILWVLTCEMARSKT